MYICYICAYIYIYILYICIYVYNYGIHIIYNNMHIIYLCIINGNDNLHRYYICKLSQNRATWLCVSSMVKMAGRNNFPSVTGLTTREFHAATQTNVAAIQ